MVAEEKKDLEKLTKKAWKGLSTPAHVPVRQVKTILERIAYCFGGKGLLPSKASGHFEVEIRPGYKVTISQRRHGKEDVVSKGVLEETVKRVAYKTPITKDQLKLYIIGAGKLCKKFRKEFEKEYFKEK